MEGQQSPNRSLLAIVWTAFVLMWAMAALIAVSLTQVIPCGDSGGSPAPASPAGRYCGAVDDYFGSGEQGGLTAALVYLWPLLVLAAVGVHGVWKCCKRVMVVVAAASSLLLALHVTLAFSLPTGAS